MNLNSIPVIGFHKSHEKSRYLYYVILRGSEFTFIQIIFDLKKEQSSALIIPWIYSTTKPIFLMYSEKLSA